MKFASALLVTALAALATVSYADLPVKCMYSDAVGTWTLHVQKEKWSSYKQCYMAWTGKSDLLPAGSAPSYDGEEQIYVQLNHPNNAIAKNSKGETFHGTWTLFYDEGFEITLNEFNGAKEAKFLSFFSFKKGCSGSGTCKTFLHNKWESQCQRTLNGWVHDADTGKWSCFWAEHTGTKTTLISEYYDPALLQVSSTGATKEQQENAESDRENEKYQSETEFVNFINSNGYSWKAKMYPELYADRTMKEMRMLGGYALAREKRLVRRVMEQYRAPILLENDEAAVEKLMNQKQFSWRNVGGIDYVAPVENQGACGSCYTFATVGMMESRIAIETARAAARKHLNREQKQAAAIELMEEWSAEQRDTILKHTVQTKLSEQHIVSCGPFTQGCSGGFSFTASKTVKDFGVTTAKCMPYIGKDGACPMRDECGNDLRPGHETDKSLADRVRFEDYTYVGGYYGGSDEKEMKRNIVMHGPVAAAFEVGRDILHYSSGVFRKRDNDERHDAPAVNAFSKTDHAILVVGWGEDDKGIKYWIVRNSWGPYWGENGQTFGSGEDERGQRGYFRIVRGVDHEGIESLPVSAVPVIPSDTDAFRSRFHVGWGQSVVPSSSSSSSSLGAAQGAAGSLEKLANSLGVSSSSSSKTSTKSAASSLDSDSLSGLMKEASAIGHLLAGSEKGKSAAGSASSETVEGIEKAVEEKLKQDSAIHEEFKREILGESGSTSHQTTLTESEKVKAKESATFRMLDNAYNTDKIDLGEIDDFDKMLDSLAESDVDTDDLDSDLE